MLVMVWMFTGFAMVVFSAAIKAIPTEIIDVNDIGSSSDEIKDYVESYYYQ